QVIQIYAATNGYLDRISVNKVEKFLADVTDYVRGNEPDLLAKIAGGDWSDETQAEVERTVRQFAEDFGYDLDEEGHPIDTEDIAEPSRRASAEDQPSDEQEERAA